MFPIDGYLGHFPIFLIRRTAVIKHLQGGGKICNFFYREGERKFTFFVLIKNS